MENIFDLDECCWKLESGELVSFSLEAVQKVRVALKSKTYIEHMGWVSALCSLRERGFASGSEDRQIKIWHTNQKNSSATLSGHSKKVTGLAQVSRDVIVSCSEDKTIKFWSIDKKQCTGTLNDHSKKVNAVVVQGNHLISVSDDKSIKIWSIEAKACLHTVPGHTKEVLCVDFISEDMFVTGSEDKTVKLWSISKQTCVNTFNGHAKGVTGVKGLGNRKIASCSNDKLVKIWSLDAQDSLSTLRGHVNEVTALVVVRKHYLASASLDSIRVWSIEHGYCQQVIQTTTYPTQLLLLDDETLVLAGLDSVNGQTSLRSHNRVKLPANFKDTELLINQIATKHPGIVKYISLEGITLGREGFEAVCNMVAKSTALLSLNVARTGLSQDQQNQLKQVWKDKGLVEKHLNLTVEGYGVLHMSAAFGDIAHLQQLISDGYKLLKDGYGRTPKKIAEMNNQKDCLEFLSKFQEEAHLEYLLKDASSSSSSTQLFAERVLGLRENIERIIDKDPYEYAPILQNIWNAIVQLKSIKFEGDHEVYPDNFDPSSLSPPACLGFMDKKKKLSKFLFTKLISKEISKFESVQKQLNHTPNRDTADRALTQLINGFRTYRDKFSHASKEERKVLRSVPVVLSGVNLPPNFLKSEPGKTLTPPIGASVSGDGNKYKDHTGISEVYPIEGCHFKYNPHAPGVEYMVSSLGNIISGQGATPTELLKVIGPDGIPRAYQASKTVVGKELQSVIQYHPDFISKIKEDNFSAMMILGVLTDPQDGKPDNYMVEFEVDDKGALVYLEILGIDNDIAFAEPIIKKHRGNQELFFMNIKNVIYFFPQMKNPVAPNFRKKILKLTPEILVIEWLQCLHKKNQDYDTLIQQGVFSEAEFKGTKVNKRGLQLPIKFQPGTLSNLYFKVLTMHLELLGNENLTHIDLLSLLEPEVAEHYKRVQSEFPNDVMKCIRTLYHENIKCLDELSRSASCNSVLRSGSSAVLVSGGSMSSLISMDSSMALRTAEEFGFEDGRTQTTVEALRELLSHLVFERDNGPDPVVLYASLEEVSLIIRQATPLHLAAEWKLMNLAEWLLKNQLIDVNSQNKQGYTALHIIAGVNNIEMATILLKYKADVTIKTQQNKTPLDVAIGRNHNEMIQLLQSSLS